MNDDNTITEVTADGPFTDEQTETLEQWAAEDGWMPEDSGEPAVQVELNRELLPDVFGGEIRADRYNFGLQDEGADVMPMQVQIEIRNAMAAEGIPVDLGNEIARRWNSTRPMSDAELELHSAQELANLRRAHGDRLPEIIAAAQSEVARLTARLPWLSEVLETTTLGNDSWIISTLANLAAARGHTAE